MKPMSLTTYVLKRRAERVYTDGGWGPQLSFTVPRATGKPLVFQMRIPDAMQLIDVARLAGAARGAPAAIGRATAALEQAKDAAGLIVCAAVCKANLEPAEQREVFATITVALAEIDGPPRVDDFAVRDSASTVRSEREVTKLSDRATEITRLSLEALTADDQPVPMKTVQYLLQTRYGALVMAFSTVHQEMFGEWGAKLFREILETGFLGEKARLY
jgi:hypothetical protein